MTKLRVGVIGAGWVAQNRHIPCWRNLGHEIAGICTLADSEKTKRKLEVPFVTSQLEAFLDLDFDVVSICSPPQNHLAHFEAVARRGVPILMEKPLVANLEEVEPLREFLETTRVPAAPAHSFRFCRSVRKGWAAIEAGDIGEILHVSAVQFSSFRRRLPQWFGDLRGGLYWDEAPHLAYLVDAFVGGAKVVFSRVSWGDTATPQTVNAEVVGPRGTGSIDMVFGSAASEWHLTVIGSKKIVDMDLFRDICIILPSDGGHGRAGVAKTTLSATTQHVAGFISSGWKHARGKLYYGHDELIRCYAANLAEPPLTILNEGLSAVRLTHDILAGPGGAMEARSGLATGAQGA